MPCEEVVAWLSAARLQRHVPAFAQLGVVEWEDLLMIEDAEISAPELGGLSRMERKRLREGLSSLPGSRLSLATRSAGAAAAAVATSGTSVHSAGVAAPGVIRGPAAAPPPPAHAPAMLQQSSERTSVSSTFSAGSGGAGAAVEGGAGPAVRSLHHEKAVATAEAGGVREIDASALALGHVLGEGAFSVVYQASWRGTDVAVKVPKTSMHSTAEEEFLRDLVALMRIGNHPHVLGLFGWARLPLDPTGAAAVAGGTALAIVTELMPGGSLIGVLRKGVTRAERAQLAGQAAAGLRHMHSLGVVHRDIAARNCLVDGHGRAVIADFGFARVLAEGETGAGETNSDIGPIMAMAPEALSLRRYSAATDVYAFGVLLVEMMLNGSPPWPASLSQPAIVHAVLNGGCALDHHPASVRASFDPVLCDVSRRCCTSEPSRRPSIAIVHDALTAHARRLTESAEAEGAAGGSVVAGAGAVGAADVADYCEFDTLGGGDGAAGAGAGDDFSWASTAWAPLVELNGRTWANRLPDMGATSADDRAELESAARTSLAAKLADVVVELDRSYPADEPVPPNSSGDATREDGSIYTGAGGNAFWRWRLARHLRRSGHDDEARSRLDQALVAIETAKGVQARKGRPPKMSFLCGHAGVLALEAAVLVSNGMADGERLPRCLEELLQVGEASGASDPSAATENDLLYGRAGFLYCLNFVRRHVPAGLLPARFAGTVTAVFDALLRSGETTAAKMDIGCPLVYFWPRRSKRRRAYLGAAHGLAGVLYVLLHCDVECVKPDNRRRISAALDWLLNCKMESGNYPHAIGSETWDELVHWCHGAPGVIPVFVKAWQTLGEAKYLEAAREASDVVWERGILKKGVALCHGICGGIYAFLAIYRCTGNRKPLYRAQRFAQYLCAPAYEAGVAAYEDRSRTVRGLPDHPWSLMEGLAGVACAAMDLDFPGESCFPGYDYD